MTILLIFVVLCALAFATTMWAGVVEAERREEAAGHGTRRPAPPLPGDDVIPDHRTRRD